MIDTRYQSLKKIHRTSVAVLHCPGCVLTSDLRCLDIFTSTRLWLLPIAGVAKNLGSSSLLSSFAGGETCNWRCFTVNWTTLHTTGLAGMAQATPSHGPGLQLSPCGIGTSGPLAVSVTCLLVATQTLITGRYRAASELASILGLVCQSPVT